MAIETTMQTFVQSMYINLQNPIHSFPITCRTTNKNKYEKKTKNTIGEKKFANVFYFFPYFDVVRSICHANIGSHIEFSFSIGTASFHSDRFWALAVLFADLFVSIHISFNHVRKIVLLKMPNIESPKYTCRFE